MYESVPAKNIAQKRISLVQSTFETKIASLIKFNV